MTVLIGTISDGNKKYKKSETFLADKTSCDRLIELGRAERLIKIDSKPNVEPYIEPNIEPNIEPSVE